MNYKDNLKGEQVMLISKWQLRDGAPENLVEILTTLAGKVEAAEEGTLMYRVHLQAPTPIDSENNPIEPQPAPIPLDEQKEVIFLEVYASPHAFSEHVKGEVFNEFREQTLIYFEKDPNRAGWAKMKTEFLKLESGFVR